MGIDLKLLKFYSNAKDPFRRGFGVVRDGIYLFFAMLSPANMKNQISTLLSMSPAEIVVGFFKSIFYVFYYSGYGVYCVLR